MIYNERLTATLGDHFVVFLIGIRINEPLRVHKWWPLLRSMPRILAELRAHPELGFIHAESWFSRTTVMIHYWRSLDLLLNYATNKEAAHLPAWRAFNQLVGTNGSVGIWHETYVAARGAYENIYVNMPPFGLGAAGLLQPAANQRQTAVGRLRA